MAERRVQQVNILLRDELANIIDREIDLPEKTFVTVTRAITSRDLRYSNILITVIGDEKEALDILEKNIYNIQQMLNRRLRMRPVPKIRFLIDEEEIKRETIEKSLAELKKKGDL